MSTQQPTGATNSVTIDEVLFNSLWGQLSVQYMALGITSEELDEDRHIPEDRAPTGARATVRGMIDRYGLQAMYSIWRWEQIDRLWVPRYKLSKKRVAAAEKDRLERRQRQAELERKEKERNYQDIQRALADS